MIGNDITTPEVIIIGPSQAQIREITLSRIKDNELLVETVLSGISGGTEMRLYKGFTPSLKKYWDEKLRLFRPEGQSKNYPATVGYITVGRVVNIGKNVRGISTGDLVWANRPHRRLNILTEKEAKFNLIPKELSPEEALFWPATQISMAGIHDAGIVLGSRVAVIGAGTIGLMTMQLAKLSGAEEVIAVDLLPKRLEVAAKLGMIPINAKEVDPGVTVKERWQNLGADIAIDCSGSSSGLNEAIRMCRMGGTVVTVSSYCSDASGVMLGEEYHKNRITIKSSMSVNSCPSRLAPIWDFDRLHMAALKLLVEQKVDTSDFITHKFPLEKIKDAYELISKHPGDVIQVVLQ